MDRQRPKEKDLFNLNRFIKAQSFIYEQVLLELQKGQKQTHWMWFIFPQINGLGQSQRSVFYSIKSKEEAIEYLNHPILGKRLIEVVKIILSLDGYSASEIFGFPDDKKLKSSMTLFAHISPENSLFHQVINKYFNNNVDKTTLSQL